MTAPTRRTCAAPGCGKELQQRPTEASTKFLGRAYCSRPCALAVARSRRTPDAPRARPTRAVAAPPHEGTFDRPDLLQAAMAAAPHVPAHRLAAVLDAVEPLFAANHRRAYLGPLAAAIREARPTPQEATP